jgi:hypothetical protein
VFKKILGWALLVIGILSAALFAYDISVVIGLENLFYNRYYLTILDMWLFIAELAPVVLGISGYLLLKHEYDTSSLRGKATLVVLCVFLSMWLTFLFIFYKFFITVSLPGL